MSGGALIKILVGAVRGELVHGARRNFRSEQAQSPKQCLQRQAIDPMGFAPGVRTKTSRHLTTEPVQCSVGLASYVGRARPPTPRCAARLADAPPLLHQPWPEESEHPPGQPRNPWSFPRSTHSPARLRGCAPASSHLRLETKLLALWCAQPHLAPPALHSGCRPTAGTPACSGTAGTRNTPRSAAPGTAHTARSSCRSDSMERSPRAHARRRSDRHGSGPFRPAAARQEGGAAA